MMQPEVNLHAIHYPDIKTAFDITSDLFHKETSWHRTINQPREART